jgi:hypothetical protein
MSHFATLCYKEEEGLTLHLRAQQMTLHNGYTKLDSPLTLRPFSVEVISARTARSRNYTPFPLLNMPSPP